MTSLADLDTIAGVKLVSLRVFSDERGRFTEFFRKEWFPERSWEKMQSNRSDSFAGVLRGLHFHHHQVDYWCAVSGRFQVGLADLRPGSATYGAVAAFEIGGDNQTGVFIPIGVAHGFLALTDATLCYVVDNYYDGDDERGVAWNDPDLAIPWGVTDPILSERDRRNPRLAELLPTQLPR